MRTFLPLLCFICTLNYASDTCVAPMAKETLMVTVCFVEHDALIIMPWGNVIRVPGVADRFALACGKNKFLDDLIYAVFAHVFINEHIAFNCTVSKSCTIQVPKRI